MRILDLPLVSRTRRIHALEHATINILTQRYPYLSLVGRSDWQGFSIYGNVATRQLEQATHEALARLKAGERHLALHPRCGTVLATTGLLSGLAAFVTLSLTGSRSRSRWASLPNALLAATLAVALGQPLGLLLQERFTTDSRPGDLRIVRVRHYLGGYLPLHRVEIN
jgi:hypothetical protein